MSITAAVVVMVVAAIVAGAAAAIAVAAARSVYRQIHEERAARAAGTVDAPHSRARVERHQLAGRR